MADLLFDLLSPPVADGPASAGGLAAARRDSKAKPVADATSLNYLAALAARPLASLGAAESQALAHESHMLLLSMQALAHKSHKTIVESATHHAALRSHLPALAQSASDLRAAIPRLDAEAVRFAENYNKSSAAAAATGTVSGETLARRKQALLLSRNVERLVDVLELPTLLSSAIGSASSPANTSAVAAGNQNTYSSALDLNAHITRLRSLYPASPLVNSVTAQADDAMRAMATSLVLSLKTPNLKLANSLRTITWLRRVLPDLLVDTDHARGGVGAGATRGAAGVGKAGHDDDQERLLGAMFLVCRLATLTNMLDALEPLRVLADKELARQLNLVKEANETGARANAWSGGQQTERFLKRYIEIFREESFAITSMFRSIFPVAQVTAVDAASLLEPMPSAIATFPLRLVDMLLETLRTYLPTVRDQASRDSLLTQVLYCAGSLGRLGGDFGLFLATLDVGASADEEWAEVVRRHRLLAGRLESIATTG